MADEKSIEEFHGFWFEKAQNGLKCWSEADLMRFLDYSDSRAFRRVVSKAIRAWTLIGNLPGHDFKELEDGTYKFTRSACFYIAMNADSRKKRVAQVQAYLADIAADIVGAFDSKAGMERAMARDELTDGLKVLADTAKRHGVVSYGLFQDEGYRGMYNMTLEELTRLKEVPTGERLLDRMDRTELAANLFRVTQTEERIRNENARGQEQLNAAHHAVGRIVREAMIATSGRVPEDLPIASTNIGEVRRRLRADGEAFEEFDEKPRLSRLLHPLPEDPPDPPDPGYTEDPEPTPDSDEVPF